jgi:hypothetical protein
MVRAQPVVHALGDVRRLDEQWADGDIEASLLVQLAAQTGLLALAGLAPAAGEQPELASVAAVEDLEQQHVVVTQHGRLVAHVASLHQDVPFMLLGGTASVGRYRR